MDIGVLAFASALAHNIYNYKTKPAGLKISRRIYKDSKYLLNSIKASFSDVIPEEYREYYYLHKFFVYIKSGKAADVQEAVTLYNKETKE